MFEKLIELWGPLGLIAAMCWFLIVKSIPRLISQHGESLQAARNDFRAELKEHREKSERIATDTRKTFSEITDQCHKVQEDLTTKLVTSHLEALQRIAGEKR